MFETQTKIPTHQRKITNLLEHIALNSSGRVEALKHTTRIEHWLLELNFSEAHTLLRPPFFGSQSTRLRRPYTKVTPSRTFSRKIANKAHWPDAQTSQTRGAICTLYALRVCAPGKV